MIAVIGDIHGCYHTLLQLLDLIYTRYGEISVFATGDLVDRGKYSAEVVQCCIETGIMPVMGNHDYMFCSYFIDRRSTASAIWSYNGSMNTIKSYEANKENLKDHIEYIRNLPLVIMTENSIISHAGISDRHYDNMIREGYYRNGGITDYFSDKLLDETGILWNREVLANLGELQVVGHTRQKSVRYEELSNAVYIDTSAFTGNKLSAVIIERGDIVDKYEVSTDSRDTGL